jgi:hypothetical protein
MRLLVCALLWGVVCAMAQRVEGVAVDSITRNGIPGVQVQLMPVPKTLADVADPQLQEQSLRLAIAGTTPTYFGTTDAQGRFRIDGVSDGLYAARYLAAEYLDENFAAGFSATGRDGNRIFQVTAGAEAVKLETRMIHMAMVSGRVVDDRGAPAPGARIDSRSGIMVGSTNMQRDGKFMLLLYPGQEYTLAVSPPMGLKPPDPDPETGRAKAWARTWYPGVASADAASKIVLPPGGQLLDVELKLQALPVHAVRGIVLMPDGKPAAKVQVAVGEDHRTPMAHTRTGDDGAFDLPGVLDGDWRLSAETESGGVKMQAVRWVEMTGRDREGEKLQLAAQFTLRGRVILDLPRGQIAPKAPEVSLTLEHPASRIMDRRLLAWPDDDGNFTEEHGYPGIYLLDAPQRLPAGYYLDGVRLGTVELTAPRVEIVSGEEALTLVYRTNGGTVRGAVENCRSGTVVLVPQDPGRRWIASIGRMTCRDNRYEFTAVRPGEYFVAAFPPQVAVPFREPIGEGLLQQASRVTVRAGEATSADLKVR